MVKIHGNSGLERRKLISSQEKEPCTSVFAMSGVDEFEYGKPYRSKQVTRKSRDTRKRQKKKMQRRAHKKEGSFICPTQRGPLSNLDWGFLVATGVHTPREAYLYVPYSQTIYIMFLCL